MEVIFNQYIKEKKCTEYTAKVYYIMNLIAVGFNFITWTFMVLFVIFDSSRYDVHAPFAVIAILFSILFLFLVMVVTFGQRDIEYKKILKQSGDQNKCTSFIEAFFIDAILMLILLIIGLVGILIYLFEFIMIEGRLMDGVEVPDFANIAEWIGFIALITGIMVLTLTFHHDRVDDYLVVFWGRVSVCCM